MDKTTVKSIAKINFGLRVLSKREDGYHNLQTLFLPVKNLYDTISFEKSDVLKFISNVPLLNNNSNLIIKALKLLETELRVNINVDIHLNKMIPIGAGLGGGSSNAASTLLALNNLFELELLNSELNKFAMKLGSDVPFFINPVPSIGTSRGEILTPVSLNLNKYILLVNPGIHVSTAKAFSDIKANDLHRIHYNELINKNTIDLLNADNIIINDFEKTVFISFPEIAKIKNTLLENGALFAQMSGTGSTVYGIFSNEEIAVKTAALFPDRYFCFVSES